MVAEDYQANWRGARRYQFDEETRRKREAQIAKQSRGVVANADKTNLAAFRQLRHGDPEKFKVLAEDIAPARSREREEQSAPVEDEDIPRFGRIEREEPTALMEDISPAPSRRGAFLVLVLVTVAASFIVTFFMV